MIPRAAWLTVASLGVSMLAYGLTADDGGLVLLMLPVVFAGRSLTARGKGAFLPPWAVGVVTLVAVVYAALRVLKNGPEIGILADFVAMLAVIKSFERWSSREDGQMLMVSIFLMLASAISSNSLRTGVFLIVYIPLLGYTAMVLQIDTVRSLGKLRDRVRQRKHRHGQPDAAGPLAWTYAGALVLVFGISVIAFVLLPRGIGGDAFKGLSRPVLGRATGFRGSIELGRGGLISTDQRVVMEVEVRDTEGKSLGASGRIGHLRGAVLTRYLDGRWAPKANRTPVPQLVAGTFFFRSFMNDAEIKQVIHLMPGASDSGMLFSLWKPIQFQLGKGVSGDVVKDDDVRTVQFAASKEGLTTYTVWSVEPTIEPAIRPGAQRTQVAFDNQTVQELTARVLGEVGLDADPARRPISEDVRAAATIQNWLRAGGGFSYTLDILDADPRLDPIEWFLTVSKSGHCEYFASSMAAMCRSVGINSRVITGYVLGEYDPEKERYIVRRSNAHAWVEVEIAPGQWREFDPTPNLASLHVPNARNFRLLRRIIDAIDGFWLTSVVSFDENSQLKLFGFQDKRQQARADPEAADAPHSGQRLIRGLLIAVLVGLLGYLIWRWYKKPVKVRVGASEVALPHAAMVARRRLLRHWKKSGRRRPEWVGLVDHARCDPEREIAGIIQRTAFGGQNWSPIDTKRCQDLFQQINDQSGPSP